MMLKRLPLLSGAVVAAAAFAVPGTSAVGQGICPPGTTGVLPYCATPSRVSPFGLSLRVIPRNYPRSPFRTRPYKFVSRGVLTFPSSVSKAHGCQGLVTVRFKRGTLLISKKIVSVYLTTTGVCRYRSTKKFPVRLVRHRTLRVKVRFGGNAYLTGKSAPVRFVRIG